LKNRRAHPASGFEERTDDGQLFVGELTFTVPVLRGGIIAATGCALLLLGSLAGLACLPASAYG